VVNHADPFLIGEEEMHLLGRLRSVRKDHQIKIRANLPPDTSARAEAASKAAIETRNALKAIQDSLVKELSRRVRSSR